MIESSENGVLIYLRIIPRARKTEVDGVHAGRIRIRLNAPPVNGAANRELCKFLSSRLGVTTRAVQLIRGEKSREKLVEVAGMTKREAEKTLLN